MKIKTYNPPHIQVYLKQREMIQRFIKRRYQEMYQEEIWDYIDKKLASITESPRWSIDFVEIYDLCFSIEDIRTAQTHNIPCDTVQEWYFQRLENRTKDNLRTFYQKNKNQWLQPKW